MELFDLEDFYYNRVNMSGWRLVDRDSDKVKESLQVMEKFHPIGASIISGGQIKVKLLLLKHVKTHTQVYHVILD